MPGFLWMLQDVPRFVIKAWVLSPLQTNEGRICLLVMSSQYSCSARQDWASKFSCRYIVIVMEVSYVRVFKWTELSQNYLQCVGHGRVVEWHPWSMCVLLCCWYLAYISHVQERRRDPRGRRGELSSETVRKFNIINPVWHLCRL